MPPRLSFSSLIALLACLLMAALLPLASAGLSASHAPVDGRFVDAGGLPASAVAGNPTHEHDAASEGESPARHQHAHSAADHSHDFPISPAEPAVMAAGHGTLWLNGAHACAKNAALATPERPPKPASA